MTTRKFQRIDQEKRVNWDRLNPQIKHVGSEITLPSDPTNMSLDSAIQCLDMKRKAENEIMHFVDYIPGFPLDVAVSFNIALGNLCGGNVHPVATPGFFGPNPPKMITVQTGVDSRVQVPVGQFTMPSVLPPEYKVKVDIGNAPDGKLAFVISGSAPRKYADVFASIAAETREVLKTSSIYRGKAITIAGNTVTFNNPPTFIDTNKIKASELVLNEDVESIVRASLWNAIEYTDVCDKMKIPLKRGILCEGPYGTGKSFISAVTAQICERHGWTFIHVPDPAGLAAALEFAKFYEPAVVFTEDIDRMVDLDRDDKANELLNILDGVTSKGARIITVLTSNHVERIAKAMLRPGRLDAVVRIGTPDEASIERLLRMYGRGLIDEKEDLTSVRKELLGQIPASIREVVERAKLFAVPRYASTGKVTITAQDLHFVATGMQRHLALLAPTEDKAKSAAEIVGEQLLKAVTDSTESLVEAVDNVSVTTVDIREIVEVINKRL